MRLPKGNRYKHVSAFVSRIEEANYVSTAQVFHTVLQVFFRAYQIFIELCDFLIYLVNGIVNVY